MQGAGGMWFYSPAYLRLLRELCDAHGVLLVFDEIATGFGRAGTLFAAERAGGRAGRDVRRQGADRRLSDARGDALHARRRARASAGPLMHGPTYMGNPLACAVALASLGLLEGGEWRGAGRARSSAMLREELAAAAALPGVREVRALGAIAVIETRGRGRLSARRAPPRSSTASGCGRFAT